MHRNDNEIVDENGSEVTPLDDDYNFYKREYEDLHDPLSDDYNKYDNE